MARFGAVLRDREAQECDCACFSASGQRRVLGQQEEVRRVLCDGAATCSAKRTLAIPELGERFDVITTVSGGGVAAQADAVKMGIARALVEFNPELRKLLRPKD